MKEKTGEKRNPHFRLQVETLCFWCGFFRARPTRGCPAHGVTGGSPCFAFQGAIRTSELRNRRGLSTGHLSWVHPAFLAVGSVLDAGVSGRPWRLPSSAQVPRGVLPCGAPFPGLFGSSCHEGAMSVLWPCGFRPFLSASERIRLRPPRCLVRDGLDSRLGPLLPKQFRSPGWVRRLLVIGTRIAPGKLGSVHSQNAFSPEVGNSFTCVLEASRTEVLPATLTEVNVSGVRQKASLHPRGGRFTEVLRCRC